MNKANVFDFSKWFLDNNLDTPRDTFKGNMKLQKLLFFAQLISLAKNDELLFDDTFCAFENGMVLEDIRLKYKNNLNELLEYHAKDLTQKEKEVLELTKNIYGNENADALSKMSHQFDFWTKYFESSTDKNNFKNKDKAKVPNEELKKELYVIKDVLDAYEIMNSDEYKNVEDMDY
ncbi:MAG: Panacea domain-containing protein [Bacilli bacterium]